MTETEVVDSSQEKQEKKNTETMSQSEDAYAPEEPTPDIPIPLLDIQMPETPESTKGQASDGDLPRLESPKLLKPVLGKVQAKKRLMAFANKFNVLPKVQNKSNLPQAHSTKFCKTKNKSGNESGTGLNTDSDSTQHFHNRHSSSGKSKKKTEEKILAIEEIRREESKSKMLLAEAMAAASLEEDYRNGQNLLESIKSMRERNKQDGSTTSRKSGSKSSVESRYSERRRHSKEDRRESATRESKDCGGSKDRYYKASHDREQRRKDKDRKDDKDKRDDTAKYEENHDKRDDERDRRENEKDRWEDVKEKRGGKEKKEGFREKRSHSREKSSEVKEKRDKEKDKEKEKEKDIMNSFSWMDLKKCDAMMDDVIDIKRRDYSERTTKNRTPEDYLQHFEQMLLLNDCRVKRYAFVAEGLDGPKEYPPESVRVTKRGRPQLLYCENPRISLFLNRQQVLQAVTTERREKMREICEVDFTRDNTEEAEKPDRVRSWYPKAGACETIGKNKWHLPISVQLPRSKWDSEDEERLSNDTEKGQESEIKTDDVNLSLEQETLSSRISTTEDINNDNKTSNENNQTSNIKRADDDNRQSASPVLSSAGNEKLASEYEQFMKMVCTDVPTSEEYSPKAVPTKTASPSNYHEFNIETNLPEDNNFSYVEHDVSGKSDKPETSKLEEKYKANEGRQNLEKITKVVDDQVSSSSSRIRVHERIKGSKNSGEKSESEDSRSIPSDWENVRIKVERLSDENSDSREVRRKKKHKKVSSSSDSSSTSSSSDTEEDTKKRKRKRKLSQDDSSYSDSDSSESSSSSSDSSSDDKRKKRRKKKRKAERRKKKAKRLARTKKKRRRKVSSDSSSSDSSDDKRKKKIAESKKSKQKRDYNEKQDDDEEIMKVIQKSASESSSPKSEKLIHSQVPVKKIKEEAKVECRKRSTEKHDVWSKEQELVRKVNKTEEKRNKAEERYLEEWEIDPMIMAQQEGDRISKSSMDKVENPEMESFRRIEKDERNKKEEHFKEKHLNINEDVQGSAKTDEDNDAKKKKKKDKEKKSSNEFLADWEKETERISQQFMQDEIRLSKKLEKQKKEKWGETEFDTLNVPSLTQLEREVTKRQLLADEWEVDSLEAVPELMSTKKKSRNSKKLEKEVRYDKKTDTYIAIEKETSREIKKRQDRLSAMRIWEEEQEEGEREAMMLLEQKKKRKRTDWDIEEESFLREKEERKEKIEDSKETMDVHRDVTVSKNLDASLKHEVSKKSKKSRWDIASQSDEKVELKAPVMWEEECAEWTKLNKFEHKIDKVALERCESVLSINKIKDEDPCVLNQQSRKSTSSSDNDLFPRKSQDLDLNSGSWTPETLTRSVSLIKSLENTAQRDVFFEKTKEQIPVSSTSEQQNSEPLEDMFDIGVKIPKKNIELYSPSSPAPSQKSEDSETFNDSNSNSLNLKEDLPRDKLEKEASTKSDEESISLSNIPLQIKYRHGKYVKPAIIEDQFEDILLAQSNEQASQKKFDGKSSDALLSDLPVNEPCPDTNYKSLRMDIFAEYESDELRGIVSNKSCEVASSTATKAGESTEGKAALKLIPKQLLIRRNNERVKTKSISDDPVQHAAALLTIQKKLRESHSIKSDAKSASSAEHSNEFDFECKRTASTDETHIADTVSTEQTTVTDVTVDSKDLSITVKTSITTKSESPGSVKVDLDRVDESKSSDKRTITEDLKIGRGKDTSDTETHSRSPSREQRRRSPDKKENDRRINDRGKERRDKKFDDRDRSDKKDGRSSRMDYAEGRRKLSPSSSRRRRRSASPHSSWEQERSRSESHSRSWSRSRSKSPKRRDEPSSKEKRSSRIDDRRERSMRSPRSNTAVYNKDYGKKYGPTKGDREDWNKRKYDCAERDRDAEGRSYDSMDVLRERNVDSERHREGRFRGGEADRTFWPYESENVLRDGNELLESYPNGQELALDYDEKGYYRDDSIERDVMEGPLRPMPKYKQRKSRSNTRRDRQWEKDRDSLDLERHGHGRRPEKLPPRGRSPPRQRRSSPRVSHDRFRRESRSRSRSWSRSRSRSRSRTRSRSRSTSRSRQTLRSRSKSPSGSRSRTRSTSGSRLRSPDHGSRMADRMRSSRSPSAGRGRIGESLRERRDEHDIRKLDNCAERGRRIETIVQTGVPRLSADSSVLDPDMHIGDGMESVATGFQYPNESEVANEYYYSENNLTYPPCIDDTATNSPKRLSLDDRLELELGIKKQQDNAGVSGEYPETYNSNVCYPSPTQQQQQMLYRQQPTVLQVGNVLQVVPADFNGVPATRREQATSTPAPVPTVRGSSQVVRVGNVLQVVPTSLDWSGGQSSTVDQPSGMMYTATVTQPSPVPAVPSVPISVPVPVPVPMPVPAVPSAISSTTPVSTLSPVPLPLSVPVPVPGPGPGSAPGPGPVPLPVTQTPFPRTEVTPQKSPAQAVYNYEVILETRRKEREERKRLREIKRKEKERRRIERINRRALRLLEKNNKRQSDNSSQSKNSALDSSVLKALRESEEQAEAEEQQQPAAASEKEEEPVPGPSTSTEEEEAVPYEDEEEEEEEEPEVEEDEEEEEEAEDDEEEEEDDEDKASTRVNSRRNEVEEATIATTSEISKVQVETEPTVWLDLPPPPLKGILVASGFRRTPLPNGNLDDLSTPEYDSDDNMDKDGVEVDKNESSANDPSESKLGKSKIQDKVKSKFLKLGRRKVRTKKSVQFADGIKPGEGTSPSGGEGDMPSPPPPTTSVITRDGIREVRRSSSRKSRKQEKRTRPPKAKKKVKVKIIKLKKPRVTPLTAMMMDDSDELDDRSPPPPPPGSPPPPHLWPTYLSAYNSTIRASEAQATTPTASNAVQAPPPPTPLPLLVPPPPLNYTIQPCSKA